MIAKLITVVVLGGFVTAAVAMYLLPILIGWLRHTPDIGAVAVIDILLGWTFIGWVVALALACRSVTPIGPVVQVMQQLSPPPPPDQPSTAAWAGPAGPPQTRTGTAPPLVLPPHPQPVDATADM
ncbi:MAG TPA: superinfection immunity protein [Streptosporangiaceae bacterium]|nr:superinfection immunity protein [Streptosporangiaceae bacterium]